MNVFVKRYTENNFYLFFIFYTFEGCFKSMLMFTADYSNWFDRKYPQDSPVPDAFKSNESFTWVNIFRVPK